MIIFHKKSVRLAIGIFSILVLPAFQDVANLATEGDKLLVTIQWNSRVDLDLFLTGPAGETIYFGNRKARAGYMMREESDCKTMSLSSKPYHETALIPAARVGRYRVSVDYILSCGSDLAEVDATVFLFNDQMQAELGSETFRVKRQELKTVAWEFEVNKR